MSSTTDSPSSRLATRSASSPVYQTRCSPLSQESHNNMSSSEQPSTSPRTRAASRLMLSVKRTLTPSGSSKKRPPDHQTPGLLSTQEESSALPTVYQFRDPDPAGSRPTVEQIAMGLHISRTPHLRPLSSSPYAFSQRNDSHRSSPIILPPAPSRSSLKKPSTTITSSSSSPVVSTPFSSASASTTTVTSFTPSSRNSAKSFAGIKLRMARFLPHNRSFSAPTSHMGSPLTSPRNSVSEAPHSKKAVRFSTDESADGPCET